MRHLDRRLALGTAIAVAAAAGTAVSAASAAGAAPPATALVGDPASLVDALVGTTGGANMFPGPDLPFGMIQWSPDTAPDRSDGGGYEYADSQLRGFSLTHISGPGCPAYGDVPILPLTGGLPAGDPGSHQEPFSHTGEMGDAGYYTVLSGSPMIKSELTATLHSAMARFTYPATPQANVLMKLLDSANGNNASTAAIVGNNEVVGSVQSGNFCGAPEMYTLHFDIVFDHPFTASQIVNEGQAPGPNSVFLTFDTTHNQVLQAKVGISFVNEANARLNWSTDNPAWDFDAVHAAAHRTWNNLLGRIQVGGGTSSQQHLFYSMLSRVLLHPNIWSDVNGQYAGFDQQIHSVPAGHSQYANFSGWDTYHSQSQLAALLAPREASDQVTSLLNDDAQSGVLPQWGFANSNNYVMVGDPAQAIIADSYAFGARGFDTATALHDMLKQATTVNGVRPGTALENQYGYLPDNGTYGCCNFHGTVSTLLENNQADFALAQYARALGDQSDAVTLTRRAQNWQNIFSPVNNLFAPKLLNGQFASTLSLTSTQGTVEGSASQYRWVVPFNHQSLIRAMGGNAKVNRMLDAFFANLNDFSGAGALLSNEFELGVQYFYDYTGQPWKTQDVVSRMNTTLYADAPAAEQNNDDLGALSSTYVWGALGIYPEVPGSAQLVISGPQFPRAVIHLPGQDNRTITINAPAASPANHYIQSLRKDGSPYSQLWFEPDLIHDGATLDFGLGSSPSRWGAGAEDAPPSYGTEHVAAIGFAGPDSNLIVNPGSTSRASIGAQSTWEEAQAIHWAATASRGVSVTPASGSLRLDSGGRRSAALMITAGQTEGRNTVTFDLTSSTGVRIGSVVLAVAVAKPGELWPYYNNVGISDDSNMSTAAFDGGCCSYSAQALAAAGVTPGGSVSAGGLTYTWPAVPSGQLDNITASGQTIQLNPTTGKTRIGLLGAGDNANPGSQGTLVVNFSDGTSQSITVGFSDWTLGAGGFPPAFGNTIAATTAYRNCTCGFHDNTTTYVFALSASLNAGKTITGVTLPATVDQGDFHVFDIGLS